MEFFRGVNFVIWPQFEEPEQSGKTGVTLPPVYKKYMDVFSYFPENRISNEKIESYIKFDLKISIFSQNYRQRESKLFLFSELFLDG